MKKGFHLLLAMLVFQGCASYKYAQKVKMVSFVDNLKKGKSAGPIRGEDCTWRILGYQLGGAPTIDKAFINARNGADGLQSAGFGHAKSGKHSLRYVNNVSTENTGFDAGIVAKTCITVTGNGYL